MLTSTGVTAVYPTRIRDYPNEDMPESALVVFEESGHSPFLEEPERFDRR